jgi:transposase-like protein
MVRPGRERLRGRVEVDETYVGGVEPGVHGRETETKSVVAVAAEEDGRGIGRIRLRRVDDVSAGSLLPFVREVVEPGSEVRTDGWPAYADLRSKGFRHKVRVLRRSRKPAHELMPRVHRVASLLKRWLLGTHQGAVSPQHLDYYLDEFTFRFNRRRARARAGCSSTGCSSRPSTSTPCPTGASLAARRHTTTYRGYETEVDTPL